MLSHDQVLRTIDGVSALIRDEDHWGQGISGRNTPTMRPLGSERHCPATALTEIGYGYEATWDYFDRAVELLAGEGVHVCEYNNADERTFPEIVALIARARALRVAALMKDKVLVIIGPGRQVHH